MHTESAFRWAVIGHGDVVERKGGPALQTAPGSALYGVLGRDRERAAAFAARFGVPRVYAVLDELLHDPLVDAVYVATPVASHCAYALAAAEAGKHVLVEKPMAMNADECRRIVETAQHHNVRLGVAYYRRCYPVIMRLRELLQTGAIGRPLLAHIQVAGSRGTPASGRPDWRVQPELGIGGCLADMGSHRLDLLLYLFGPASNVCAVTDAPAGGVEDCATVLAAFGQLQACCMTTWNAGAGHDSIDIIGDQGRLTVEALEQGTLIVERGGHRIEEQHTPMNPTHLGLIADFLAAAREGRAPICSGVDGMATNDLLLAAYAAKKN